jgi:hypothetical protein
MLIKINHLYIKYQINIFYQKKKSINPQINIIKKTSHFAFGQIYKLQRYGQDKMHVSVINVLTNLDKIQSILRCLSHGGATIDVFLK